jgi:Leucine-rich repeat (LRR) protein
MSELALRLIAENKKTRATFLDLGNCGLTEVPDEIGDLVWLEGLSFAGVRWNGKHQYESKNIGDVNNIAQLSSCFERLKQLKRLFLNCVNNKKIDLSDLRPLAGLDGLQQLFVTGTQVSDLSPLANLSRLQNLHVSNTPVADLSPLANLSGLQELYAWNTQIADLILLCQI